MSAPETSPAAPAVRLTVAALSDANRAAVIELARVAWDRPNTEAYFAWRYRDCPTQEAATAMAGNQCVATLFAIRRSYVTATGDVECLEPFDWHAEDEWRARGAGLRVVKSLMAGHRPILALGGTEGAQALFRRLGWTEISRAERLSLPRSGAYFVRRGRSPMFGRAFDLLGRWMFPAPRPTRRPSPLEPTAEVSPEVLDLVRAQRRFAAVRLPDFSQHQWLASAPAAVGKYLAFHYRVDGRIVGWATARVNHEGGVRVASIQECFLGDDFTDEYARLARDLVVALERYRPDVITTVTNCPHLGAALRGLRFRRDEEQTLFAWWPGGAMPPGAILVDAAHAEWAFFPIATAAEAAALPAGLSPRS